MAINLASKYSDQIAEVFTRSSFIKGKTAETFDLTGVYPHHRQGQQPRPEPRQERR